LLLEKKNKLKSLKVNSTPKTPEINFDPKKGDFQISGISIPEDSIKFYKPIIDWLKKYVENSNSCTVLSFKLAYVNTSSLQALYDVIFLLDDIHNKTSQVLVKWYYLEEDLDMKEIGEDLQEALTIDFSFIEVMGD
jgi:hypothetical protein